MELLVEARREGRRFARNVALSLPAAWQLADECERRGIRHVHVHSCGRAALVAAIANRMRGLDYSLTLHGPLDDYGPGQRFKWRGARFATVITQKLLDDVRLTLAGDLPPRITIQAMGVDTENLTRDAAYEGHREGEPLRVFSCGRLNVVKGHQDLMAAVRILLDRGQQVTLEIAGEDDAGGAGYRRELEGRIRELGLESHVRLLGAIDAEEVRRHLLRAHVFVLASWHEPLGVALMEAMSCEVPTIGTAAGGVRELIRDGVDGVLVAPKDPSALAAALVELARDSERCIQLGRAGRQRIVTSFHAGLGAEALIRETNICAEPDLNPSPSQVA